jgi:Second Messenger Oligonucleotide or Dinucleotide Synthetase domain
MLAAERFRRLLSDLALEPAERISGIRAHKAVHSALQAHYYGHLTITDHSRLIGAWAKGTEVRPRRSIDLLFVLPKAVRDRNWPVSSVASAALLIMQDVALVLGTSGRAARIRSDGFAIAVPIGPDVVDVRPAFGLPASRYQPCHAQGAGDFYTYDPSLEEANLRQADHRSRGNARDLIRLLKCWQTYRTVPIASIAIELLSIEFLATWPRAGDQSHFYDWMIRDFFAFLLTRAGCALAMPGSDTTVRAGAAWLSAARTAHTHAAKACACETDGLNADAWWEWEKIFGELVPFDA